MLGHAGSTSPTSWIVEWIDDSVAPPRLIVRISRVAARNLPGRVTGIQSPPSNASRRLSGRAVPPASTWSSSSCSSAGAEFHTVTSCAPMRSSQ